MLQAKASNIILHIAGCIIFLLLPLLFPFAQNYGQSDWNILFSPNFLFFYLFFLTIFYLNTYLFVPRLFLKNRYMAYTVMAIILIVIVYFVRPFDRLIVSHQNRFQQTGQEGRRPPQAPNFYRFDEGKRMPPPLQDERYKPGYQRRGPAVDIISMFLLGTIFTMGFAIQIRQLWRVTEQRAIQAEADKVSAELSFLKAQINPHFLFNTLNNLYSLAIMNSEHTAGSILKLSNIMRHVTDESGGGFVSLEEEVNCIRDYIDLQKLRLSKKVQLDVKLEGDFAHKKIAPLILMTFIENVFKYGISNHEASQITIHLLAKQSTVKLYCSNPVFNTPGNHNRQGIGLDNTRKRLVYIYPNKHLLNITEKDNTYTTELTITV